MEVPSTSIKGICKAYENAQDTVVNLPVDVGEQLIEVVEICIGWVISRICEKTVSPNASSVEFMNTWHKTAQVDRSKSCIKYRDNATSLKIAQKPHYVLYLEQDKKLEDSPSMRRILYQHGLKNYPNKS